MTHIRYEIPGLMRDREPLIGPPRLCRCCGTEPAASLNADDCVECLDAMWRIDALDAEICE